MPPRMNLSLVSFAALLFSQISSGFALVSSSSSPTISRGVSLKESSKNEVDVSEFGLTMADFNAPLPKELLQGISSSGYESTSRISTVDDHGCMWEEDENGLVVTLTIPGLRGQPAASLALEMTENTATVAAFGVVTWSCIMRGIAKPKTASFGVVDGENMVPVVQLNFQKADASERWGGFIDSIGEDSIL